MPSPPAERLSRAPGSLQVLGRGYWDKFKTQETGHKNVGGLYLNLACYTKEEEGFSENIDSLALTPMGAILKDAFAPVDRSLAALQTTGIKM
mmetsp:Transcript_1197/g.1823  ORF Transcript_1197/g.1823 Transcript_1197/m.1823 type:complete len:92 (+) Transcript_1197:113-388(+)